MKATRLILLLASLAISPSVNAQSTFGSIVGVTQDANLAVVPEATITIKNLDENSTRSTLSNDEGSFQFLNLKPGRYEVSATKSGFSEFKTTGLLLEARQSLRVEIAVIGATIDVTTDAATANNTESGTIGANFAPPAVDVSTPATFGRTTTVQAAENARDRTGQIALWLEF